LSNGDDALEATSVDREMLVNVNCPIKMILNYIRKVARVIGTCKWKSNKIKILKYTDYTKILILLIYRMILIYKVTIF